MSEAPKVSAAILNAIPIERIYHCGGILETAPAGRVADREKELAGEMMGTASPEALGYFNRYMNDIDANNLSDEFCMGKSMGGNS